MAESEVKVAVEKVIHDVLAETLQNIFNEYGICVKTIDAEWLEIHSDEQSKAILSGLVLRTQLRINR